MCQRLLEKHLIQNTQIYKHLQDWFSVATQRVRCGKVQKVCLHPGGKKDLGSVLELPVVSRASPHQEAERSALEAEGPCWKLRSVDWKPGDDFQVGGEDESPPKKNTSDLPSSFPL